ncbi:MAG: hypothetical protein NDJ94_19350 [Vicinamibacteria bacterium]|jgi:hypothetical protein|nr:hypothetical protein [Vicinamibacteria bacterium]
MNHVINHPAATAVRPAVIGARQAPVPATRPTPVAATRPTPAAAADPVAGGTTRFGTAHRARRAVVHVVTERHHYHGTLYVPDGKKRVSDVLCDGKPFLNLTEVSTDGGAADEFLAINKSAILSLRIVREEQTQAVSIRAF